MTETRHSSGTGGARRLDVVAPVAGPIALVLFLAGITVYDAGTANANPTARGTALLQAFAANIEAAPAACVAYLLAALAMVIFSGALWDGLRAGQPAQWPAVLAVGGAIVLAVEMVEYARNTLSAIVAVDHGDVVTVSVLMTTTWESARVSVVGTAAMMTGAAVSGRRGALPRWFALLSLAGAVVAVCALVATALPVGFLEGSPAGFLATMSLLWVFPAGLIMSARAARLRRAGTPGHESLPATS